MILFNITTHNRREDFYRLMSSIEYNRDIFLKHNVKLDIIDNESDVPINYMRDIHTKVPYFFTRVNDQKANHGLAGGWELSAKKLSAYYVFCNHDTIIGPSIDNFFSRLYDLGSSQPFVLGPTSNEANPHQLPTESDIEYQEKHPEQRSLWEVPSDGKYLVHGFFWATNRVSTITASYNEEYFFNPNLPFAGTEDDWQKRLLARNPSTKLYIERSCYVHHEHHSDWRKK